MADSLHVFDRTAHRRNRDRAAASFAEHDFLFRAAADGLADRLDDIKRDFPMALELGARTGLMAAPLAARGVETVVQCDLSEAMLRRATGLRVAADEEAIPFADASFDLVVSCLSLHWVNDLPGALIQINRALKPDGLFLAALLGGETLRELRQALLAAEAETAGGAHPRVSPFAEVRDAGDLLVRAGFALPVADGHRLDVSYGEPLKLFADLRAMGEANAVRARGRGFLRRDTLMRAAEIYADAHAGPDGRVPATFEVVTLTAWAPDASQPKPLARGSAQVSLADALKGDG